MRTRVCRTLLGLLAAVAVLAAARPGRADVIDFNGTMIIEIGSSIPPAELAGLNTATVKFSAGGQITELTIPANFFDKRTFLPVVNGAAINQLILTGTQGGLRNQKIALTIVKPSATRCDKGHLKAYEATPLGNFPKRGVRCPGVGLAGFGGLDGFAFVGLFTAETTVTTPGGTSIVAPLVHTPGSATVPSSGFLSHTEGSEQRRLFGNNLTFNTRLGTAMERTFLPNYGAPVANLDVPLSIVGGGSTAMTVGAGIQVTVSGAGWTTGKAYVYNATVTGMRFAHAPYQIHEPLSVFVATSSDFAYGTGSTVTRTGHVKGSRAMGDLDIQLVSPVQIFNNATSAYTNTWVTIRLVQAPEPGATALVFGGLGALSLVYGLRRRSR